MKDCTRNNFSLVALLLWQGVAHTLGVLDCQAQISRSALTQNLETEVCTHFQGIPQVETYREWYNDKAIDAQYTNSVFLHGSDPSNPEDGAAIHWKIVDDTHLEMAIAVRATGWLGFGIAEAGGMLGADMVLFEAARPDRVIDAYTTDERYPRPDDCSDDWELLDSSVLSDEGFLMVQVRRLLDTGDPQDKVIINDASTLVPPHRVIAAWGDTPEVGYHGLNRARGAIRFFGTGDEQTTFDNIMANEAEGRFFVGAPNHLVNSRTDTEYFQFCVDRDRLLEQGVLDTSNMLNIIGFEPVLQKGNEFYIHHFILSGSTAATCNGGEFDEIAYVWAPGDQPLALPDNLGAPLFGIDGFQSFEIEIHYNNPNKTPNIRDSSGVRIYWTSEARQDQIGILTLGDPDVNLDGTAVGRGVTKHSFDCSGSCSSFVGQEVTVLREYLHMHETGARMVNEQTRSGDVIREGTIDYWEFDQNGNLAVQQDPFVLKPGDGFRTTCFYEERDFSRKFGVSSSEEMCMAFLYYYPRQRVFIPAVGRSFAWTCSYDVGFPPCESDYSQQSLSSIVESDRAFGVINDDSCIVEAAPSDSIDDSSANFVSLTAAFSAAVAFLFFLL